VDLPGQSDHGVPVKAGAGDDGPAVGDGRVDGGHADVLIVQPDADGAALLIQAGGGVPKRLGALIVKFQGDVVFRSAAAGHRAVLGGGVLHAGTVQDQLAIGAGPLPEGQVGRGADLLDGRLRVEGGLVRLPGKLQDQAVLVVVRIQLVVGDVQAHQAVLNDRLGRVQLLVGGVKAVRGQERHVHAAFDVHAEADVLRTLDVGGGHISIGRRYA